MATFRRPGDSSRRAPMNGYTSANTLAAIQKVAVLTVLAAAIPSALAHEHTESKIQEGDAVSQDPIDSTLWAHIFLQMLVFGILFPVGMVLGIVKSRWHVPVQILATILSILGGALGHMHGGREFLGNNVHEQFGDWVYILMFSQVGLGIYLRLHLEKGINGRIRPLVKLLHSINGKAFPLVSWVQMLFGGITALGFCQGDHLGQCLAHFIMGSAFIAYGIMLTILLLVGQLWLRRTGRSQEFFDSVVIAAWGLVNSLTEHRWGTAWVKNDFQHTSMGVIWLCAGLAGVWLSKDKHGNPQRNFIPGFVIMLTGWAMSAHPQELMVSAMTHKMFGYTLMAAGITRIIEIAFVLKDKASMSAEDTSVTNSFQYLPAFLLYASGFLFMGATEEQMDLVGKSGIDHVTYVLILYSMAFLLFLFVNMLIHVYDRAATVPTQKGLNGHAVSGRSTAAEENRMRDAEEFELDGLMSDDEDEERAQRKTLLKEEPDVEADGMSSPSTLGRNNDRTAR